MKYIAAKIHNNSLGKVLEVSSQDEGKEVLRSWVEEQFERPLTNEEVENLNDKLEIYNEDDMDNLFCFSIGIVE